MVPSHLSRTLLPAVDPRRLRAEGIAKLQLLALGRRRCALVAPHSDVAEDCCWPSYAGTSASRSASSEADISRSLAVFAAGAAIWAQGCRRARKRLHSVNVVDRPDFSTFIFPASSDRGDCVAIGTGGSSPVARTQVAERIEAILPHAL